MSDPRTFQPLPWQLAPWQDTSPIMLLAGGAGSGKSVFALHKLNALCLRFPGYLGLVLRKSRQSLRNSSVAMLESITPAQCVHVASKFRFEYPNGSRIVYGGMYDAKQREAIRSVAGESGSGADGAVMEEASAFTEADFEEIVGRMRGTAAPWRQIMLPTNPDAETHWLNQRFVRPWTSGKPPAGLSCYFPRPEDNPTLDAAYIAALRSLTGVRRKRLYEGLWVRAEGTVYADSWDSSVHIVDPFEIPRDWRRIRAIDLGFVNPRVCLWIAIDPDGGMVVYRQIYRTKQRATDFAKEIKRRSAGELIEATICDHDAGERADLEAEGILTIPAVKDVTRGIQAVEARLGVVHPETGIRPAPRLRFIRGSLVQQDDELRAAFKPCSTEEEFDVYVWARRPDGSVNKEEPKKECDHGLDALRYAVMYEDKDCFDPAGNDEELIRRHLRAAQRDLGHATHSPQPMSGPGFGYGRGGGSKWL